MSEHGSVYDLGSLDPTPRRPNSDASMHPTRTAPLRTAVPRPVVRNQAAFDPSGTLSLFVPGAGQIVRGDVALGLFFLSSLAFMGSLGWALVVTLDRVTATLRVLDFPGAPAVWALSTVFAIGGALHMASVLSANPHVETRAPHPVVAGVASAIVPGWGQILNGSYKRACLFVGSLWLISAIWILASPAVQANLESLRLFIPPEVLMICSPAVRFTAPAVIWALSIYDAAATAAAARR
jgi:TM2 domain-containing membrane protein YozV